MAAEIGIAIIEHPSVKDSGCAAVLTIEKDLESGQIIMLADNLDEDLRADVIVFGFAVLGGIPEVVADSADGYILVGRERRPTEPDSVSHVAWHVAHLCGRHTSSATFGLFAPTTDLPNVSRPRQSPPATRTCTSQLKVQSQAACRTRAPVENKTKQCCASEHNGGRQ
ncbi:hypothetical protein [Prauserella muralis]|uniref:hypothetical protein n=1 Tax=Prauserella muralis TaxID=588067 RepID=UPI0011ADF5E2|nr:hypothetical protein [Prauserella muralis]TWE27521.1 hypothetical protein FHX69_0156 [Prauserella muralis]